MRLKKVNRLRILLYGGLVIFVGYLAYTWLFSFYEQYRFMRDSPPVIDSHVQHDYLEIFKRELRNEVADLYSISNKGRNPIVKGRYRSSNFLVYKFAGKSNLAEIDIHSAEEDPSLTPNTMYRRSLLGPMIIRYPVSQKIRDGQVSFSYRGTNTVQSKVSSTAIIIKTNLIAAVLGYDGLKQPDIVISPRDDREGMGGPLHVVFMFVQKNASLYLVILFSTDNSEITIEQSASLLEKNQGANL